MKRIETIEPTMLSETLGYLLATPGHEQPAGVEQVARYLAYLEECPITWEGSRTRRDGLTTAVFLALLLPGSTAILMIPTPGLLGIDAPDQLELLRHGLGLLGRRNLHYAQLLLEPQTATAGTLLDAAGLRHLARLDYLQRDARYPWCDPPHGRDALWVAFDESTRDAFAAALVATYEDSLDCAELTGIRPIEDVIASHQATGRFDPRMWELARVDGEDAGCLLLATLPQTSAVEVVYMGVVPRFRRRRIGALLLRRALQRCRAARQRSLTLVVDERNTPARQLYDRFGFRPLTTRDAYWYRWPNNERC